MHFSQAAGGKLFGGCAAQDKLFPVLESYVSFSEKISLKRPSRFQLARNNQRETAESSKKKKKQLREEGFAIHNFAPLLD